jgi:hypothetical protein
VWDEAARVLEHAAIFVTALTGFVVAIRRTKRLERTVHTHHEDLQNQINGKATKEEE